MSPNLSSHLLLSSFLSASLVISSAHLCSKEDSVTLLNIKNWFRKPPTLASWDPTTDCCSEWNGVGCNADGRVNYLLISDNNASVPIPHSLAELPALAKLYIFNHPRLYGCIPRSLAKLQALAELNIYGTSLSGHIPSYLCDFPRLHYMDLSANRLTGRIPACLGGKFTCISLALNRLSGRIPASLMRGAKSDNTALNLFHNQLSGPIPRSLGEINFATISLSGNRLVGDASFLFGASKSTNSIDLSRNRLEFDGSYLELPPNLVWLDLSHNKIRGNISKTITKLENLDYLDLSYNRLCGPVPEGGNMKKFGPTAYANNKCLCGTPLPPCH